MIASEQVDPDTAERLHPNDAYRIIRALETIETTGRPISEHHQDHGFADEPFDALKIGLRMDREKLYDRIDQRVDLMIEAELLDEVKKLLGMGYKADLKAMQSIGYRHMAAFIEGQLPWDECVRTLKRDTRRFAKRQFTWFGADQRIQWYEPDQLNEIIRLVEGFFGVIRGQAFFTSGRVEPVILTDSNENLIEIEFGSILLKATPFPRSYDLYREFDVL